MRLVPTKDVPKGGQFLYAGLTYRRATQDEEAKHTIRAKDSEVSENSVPAYRSVNKGQRVPCGFAPETRVWVV